MANITDQKTILSETGPVIAVAGAGMWGAVLAGMLSAKGNSVRVWDPQAAALDHLARERRPRSLPDWTLDDRVRIEPEFSGALEGCDLCALAASSDSIGAIGEKAAALGEKYFPRRGWVLCSKGLEPQSGRTLSQVLAGALGPRERDRIGVLSGPCIAAEVARGVPTSVVVAAPSADLSIFIQSTFLTSRFRVYTHNDLLGVELCGALKNVIAIAAGICDGLGFGANTKSALITRGLAEMTRLGIAMGASGKTFAGLAGMGDLVVTSFSPHSRNRRCGEALGQGRSLAEARAQIGMAIEGISAAEAACRLGRDHCVELPICEAVREILEGRLQPGQAVDALMRRNPKPEC